MTNKMKIKLENLSRLYNAWDAINDFDLDECDYAKDQLDKVIISITQELVELYRNSNETDTEY